MLPRLLGHLWLLGVVLRGAHLLPEALCLELWVLLSSQLLHLLLFMVLVLHQCLLLQVVLVLLHLQDLLLL